MRRAFSMISLLVSVLLIGIMVAVYLTGGFGLSEPTVAARPDNVGRTVIGRSAARAKDEVCRNNLSQLRIAIRIEADQDNTPQTLMDVPGMGDTFKRCPIEPHESYVYDPGTGQVTCPHPGHERF